MRAIYKIRGSKDSYLIINSSGHVINGYYQVELSFDGKTAYHKGPQEYWADQICNVPPDVKGDYRDILEWFHKNSNYVPPRP
jgi:hypothetical protein